jgi:hypothetical protein
MIKIWRDNGILENKLQAWQMGVTGAGSLSVVRLVSQALSCRDLLSVSCYTRKIALNRVAVCLRVLNVHTGYIKRHQTKNFKVTEKSYNASTRTEETW